MSNLDPAAFPRSPKDLARWQKWVEDRLKYLGSSRSLIRRASVAGGVVTILDILTNPSGFVRFVNTDTATATGPGVDIAIPLSRIPKPGSEQVFYNGTPLKRADWSRTDSVLTIPGESWFRAGKVAWVDYAYDGTAALVGPVITTPANGTTTTDTTPTIAGTAPALRHIDVFVDGVSVGSTTSTVAGTWTLDVPSGLTAASHIASAVQTEPDGTHLAATPVSFAIITVAASFSASAFATGDHSSVPIPGTPTAGDLLVLVISATNQVGCSDSRFTQKIVGTRPTWTGPLMGVWVGTDDGSGTPVSVLMDSVAGSGGADSCAAIMRIKGNPLLPAASETTVTGTAATFAPTMPTAGSFGIIAIASEVGLVSSTISDELLGNWTTRVRVSGAGGGKTSIYLGTATGLPAGQWNQFGSDPLYNAWIAGLQ